MNKVPFWTDFIRWKTALGRRDSIRETSRVSRRSTSHANVDLDTRIDHALEDLEQLDRKLSEIALVLVERVDDPSASRARARWKKLTAALVALTTTADELLE